jgi:2-polyprenyl-3-methyl-5-hydroxy-6-metoxy-1,4-benzoquinol methylase
MPLEEDLKKVYENYYTHEEIEKSENYSTLRRLYYNIRDGYLSIKYGYNSSLSISKKTSGIALFLFPIQRSAIDYSISFLPAMHNGTLLDVGCGNGDRLLLLRELGWQVEGIDIDEVSVRNSRNKGLKVHSGTLHDQKYPECNFDAVILNAVIEHVHNPLEILRECRRILKPFGKTVITTPNCESFGHVMFKSDWRGLEPPRHISIMTMSSLKKLALIAGFNNVKVNTIASMYNIACSYALGRKSHLYQFDIKLPKITTSILKLLTLFQMILMLFNRKLGETIVLQAVK